MERNTRARRNPSRFLDLAEERGKSTSSTVVTPSSNSAKQLADVARISFYWLSPTIRASFLKKMLEDATILNVLQYENYWRTETLSDISIGSN